VTETLDFKRQRYEGGHLGHEAAHRGQDREREDRPLQQVKRQQRRRSRPLVAHQQPAEPDAEGDLRHGQRGRGMVRQTAVRSAARRRPGIEQGTDMLSARELRGDAGHAQSARQARGFRSAR
jgi:hypothetical protein